MMKLFLLAATVAAITTFNGARAEEKKPETPKSIQIPIQVDNDLLKEKLGENEDEYTPGLVSTNKDGQLILTFDKAEKTAAPIFNENDDRALRGRHGRPRPGRLEWYKTTVSPPFGVQDPDLYCNRAIQWYRLCRGVVFQVCTDYAVQDAYYDFRSGRCVVAIHR